MDQKIPTFSRRNELSKQKQMSCDDYEKKLWSDDQKQNFQTAI